MELSVVIVNYNVCFFLELCLRSVQKACAGIDAEVIVVDNCSSDNSCKMVRDEFPEVRLLENKKNLGFSAANNQGVAMAQGTYVLILNPDTVVKESCFETILNFAQEQKKFGALGIRLIDGSGVFLPESKRGIPTIKASLFKIFSKNNTSGHYYAHHLPPDKNSPVEILVGAFMLLKKSVYESVGGFDEDYFMYGEDIDLSYKLLKEGYQNYYVGETSAIHFKGESTRKDVRYLKHFHKAMQIFYKKHFKTNVFFDLFAFMGIKFWFFVKYLKLTNAPIILKDCENILYLGDPKIGIDADMSRKLKCSKFRSFKQLEKYISRNVIEEVWFDASYLSYEKIIDTIDALSHQKRTFKIHAQETSYVIGSNSKDGRGEVIGLASSQGFS